MAHQDLVLMAHEAITAVFSDRSVPRNITRDSLEELSEAIDVYITTIDQDEKAEDV